MSVSSSPEVTQTGLNLPNEDHQQQQNDVEAEEEEEEEEQAEEEKEKEDMTAQSTIDKYSNALNEALLSSDVAAVRRLCRNEAVRNYSPYHLTQLEDVLGGCSLTGDAQLQCWYALSQAWPASVESNLRSLIRTAVESGPLEVLPELIQKLRERSVRLDKINKQSYHYKHSTRQKQRE